MQITAIHTPRISAGSTTLTALLDSVLTDFDDGSILAVTSKIVSLCQNQVLPIDGTDLEQVIREQSDQYMTQITKPWGFHFTITNDILIPRSGIDESNAGGQYVLWPVDPLATANHLRAYLRQRFDITRAGVIITDSTVRPLRRGVAGIPLAYSGFQPLRDYRGQPDLFGRPFTVSRADIAGGLAAAAVLVMGEGSESTPLAICSDLTNIVFSDGDPTPEELALQRIGLEEDVFAPFLTGVEWARGGRSK